LSIKIQTAVKFVETLRNSSLTKWCIIKIVKTCDEFASDYFTAFDHFYTWPTFFSVLELFIFETFYFPLLWVFYRLAVLFFLVIYSFHAPFTAFVNKLLGSYGVKLPRL